MEKIDTQSASVVAKRLEDLRQLFPSCFTESEDGLAVDFDQLRSMLQVEVVEGDKERYRFTWPGKRQAIATANERSNKTLRPDRESSVNFDTTRNLYIEGDNLEALKMLQKCYRGGVDLIYIDPPYNTGNDFIYRDDFKVDAQTFAQENGEVDEEGNRLVANRKSEGRFHTNWLNMMYPRLWLARDLLADSGVIFISIDENEVTNLQKLCDEVFGASNNLGVIVWDKRNPKGEAVGVSYKHEYVLCYCRAKDAFSKLNFAQKKEHAAEMLSEVAALVRKYPDNLGIVRQEYKKWLKENKAMLTEGERAYSEIDDLGQIYRPVSMAAPDKPDTRSHVPLLHPITGKPCPVPAKGWRNKPSTMLQLLQSGSIVFGLDESTQPQRKYLLRDHMDEAVGSILSFGGEANTLGVPFTNPKPTEVLQKLLYAIHSPNAVILDFFSGSATTAHAVMQLNAEDGGNRQFIMVQLPENLDDIVFRDKNNVIAKNCVALCDALNRPHLLTEMGKERIRRAAAKIKSENPMVADQLDTGFRVLRIDSSNMKEVHRRPDELTQSELEELISNFKPDRTPEDLLFQSMLNLGLPLSVEYTKEIVAKQTVFNVGENHLIACFEPTISLELVTEIAQQKPNFAVFLNSAMDDSLLANIEQVFKIYSPGTARLVL